MIFETALDHQTLPDSDVRLKTLLNYNPVLSEYTRRSSVPGRSPNETDRGGWRGYDRVYTQYISTLKDKSFTMLEVGVHYGYGILAWQRYFKQARIYGVDNLLSADRLATYISETRRFGNIKKAQLYEIDSTTNDGWTVFHNKLFDVIIDDGDHHPTSQLSTIDCAWEYLAPGGLYFIEDVSHRYGEEPLKLLSDKIEQLISGGHKVNIYSHYNTGLRYLLDNNFLHYGTGKSTSATEYIVVIEKKR